MKHNETYDVVVIGAGIIGLSTAFELLKHGRKVTVLEMESIGNGSSYGNSGTITPSHVIPLSTPEIVTTAAKWLWTPDAPLYVHPGSNLALWKWLFGFTQRALMGDWKQAALVRAELLNLSNAQLRTWVADYHVSCHYQQTGLDYVFANDASVRWFEAQQNFLRQLDIDVELIDGNDYRRDETAVTQNVVAAARFNNDAALKPDLYLTELARLVRDLGGEIIEHVHVDGVVELHDCVEIAVAGQHVHARDVVVATGAWSGLYEKSFGLGKLPLQPGKGYSITYTPPAIVPKRPLILWERRVFVTAWPNAYRLGSTMEFSGHDASLNQRRLNALETSAAHYLRYPVGETRLQDWAGWRPMSIDEVPVIGQVPGKRHVWVATGHGMLGVSMSAGTAKLLVELMMHHTPSINPDAYSPTRFL